MMLTGSVNWTFDELASNLMKYVQYLSDEHPDCFSTRFLDTFQSFKDNQANSDIEKLGQVHI
jgi:hypothetical protein